MTPAEPWPSDEAIAAAHQTSGPRGLDRTWSCFDFSDCPHTTNTIMRVAGWDIEVCHRCGNAESHCPHEECEWNEAGTLLRCKLCGNDGT